MCSARSRSALGRRCSPIQPARRIFWGIIGGPPCQDFSGLRRTAPTGYGLEMLEEYCRVVYEAGPEWWLMENVARVPSVTELGHTYAAELGHAYTIQRLPTSHLKENACYTVKSMLYLA